MYYHREARHEGLIHGYHVFSDKRHLWGWNHRERRRSRQLARIEFISYAQDTRPLFHHARGLLPTVIRLDVRHSSLIRLPRANQAMCWGLISPYLVSAIRTTHRSGGTRHTAAEEVVTYSDSMLSYCDKRIASLCSTAACPARGSQGQTCEVSVEFLIFPRQRREPCNENGGNGAPCV